MGRAGLVRTGHGGPAPNAGFFRICPRGEEILVFVWFGSYNRFVAGDARLWRCDPVWYEERAESSDVQLPNEQRLRAAGGAEASPQALARQRCGRVDRRGQPRRRGRRHRRRRGRRGRPEVGHRPGQHGRRPGRRAARRKAARAKRAARTERAGTGDNGHKKDHKDRGKEVPCDSDKLIQAIVFANNNHGGELKLAKDCTYTLTRYDNYGNGLPVISSGSRSRVTTPRSCGTPPPALPHPQRRRGGHLTLKGLTIKNGQTLDPEDGGDASRPRRCGRATRTRSRPLRRPRPASRTCRCSRPNRRGPRRRLREGRGGQGRRRRPGGAGAQRRRRHPGAAGRLRRHREEPHRRTRPAATAAASPTSARPACATPRSPTTPPSSSAAAS